MDKKVGTRLRELALSDMRIQDAGSRNLGLAFFTIPVVFCLLDPLEYIVKMEHGII